MPSLPSLCIHFSDTHIKCSHSKHADNCHLLLQNQSPKGKNRSCDLLLQQLHTCVFTLVPSPIFDQIRMNPPALQLLCPKWKT